MYIELLKLKREKFFSMFQCFATPPLHFLVLLLVSPYQFPTPIGQVTSMARTNKTPSLIYRVHSNRLTSGKLHSEFIRTRLNCTYIYTVLMILLQTYWSFFIHFLNSWVYLKAQYVESTYLLWKVERTKNGIHSSRENRVFTFRQQKRRLINMKGSIKSAETRERFL